MSADVTLIELDDADFERMLAGATYVRDGLAAPPGGVDAPGVVAHVRAIARRLHERDCRGSWLVAAAGEAVGMIGYHQPPADGQVEIGYGIAASRRRRGFATAAVREIVRSAARDPRIRSIVAHTAVANEASAAALARNGFVAEGRAHDPEDGETIVWRRRLAPFASIDHVQLAMPAGAENAARAFYTGLLGLEEIAKPAELAGRGGAWFASGEVRLHLGVEAEFRPARKAHPAFRCAAYDETLARLEAGGGRVVRDGTDFLGDPHAYIDDPFGNRIELIAVPPAE